MIDSKQGTDFLAILPVDFLKLNEIQPPSNHFLLLYPKTWY